MHYGASVSEVADSTAARSQSLNPPYLLSTATQTRRRGVYTVADSVANVGESVYSLPWCKHGRGLPRGPRPTSVNTPSDTICVFIMLLFTIR